MAVMGQVAAVRMRVVLWVLSVSIACLTAGFVPGPGPAHNASAAAPRCIFEYGEQVTLRLTAPARTVRANVGEAIKVVVNMKGDYMHVPTSLSPKQAAYRCSWHRVSAGKVIAVFLVQRPARRITFQSYGEPGSKGCPRDSHGCPHSVEVLGYAKIGS